LADFESADEIKLAPALRFGQDERCPVCSEHVASKYSPILGIRADEKYLNLNSDSGGRYAVGTEYGKIVRA
jgi:hypothetical protein